MLRSVCFVFTLLFLLTGSIQAATFTGRITAISPDHSQITVESRISKDQKTFSVDPRTFKISIQKKPGKVDQLSVGDLITVFTTDSGEPLRIYMNSSPSGTPSSEPAGNKSSDATNTSSQVGQQDWSQFLGSDRTNRSNCTGLLKTWPAEGLKLLWTARDLGEGYSSVSVVNGKVFTMGTRADQEAIFAIDLASGRELWAVRQGSIFREGQGNGPRSTPTYDNGHLYTLGAAGDLSCTTENGQLIWTKNILQDFEAKNIIWGISESPLIDGDHLICTPGGLGATMVCLNKKTGNVVWIAPIPQDPQAGYASPVIANLNGRKQYINFCHSGLFGVDAQTGRPLWGDNSASNDTANCSSAIVMGNTVFYASGYGTGGSLLSFEGNNGNKQLVYKTEKMKNHHGGMVEWNGYIYGANDSILTCLNAKTGSITWQDRLEGKGKGAITLADGQLYFRSELGPMYLIEANPDEFMLNGQFEQPERSGKNAWARPVVADGKLFLRDQSILLCYQLTP
ncbi:MAG: PQQ-binding-like beta-propeller repeat protein [Planctomycetaceae bacterium]|nr:PQQ-binding-like beta-propeller repeat protein [Planctomycetaceae bacterium]